MPEPEDRELADLAGDVNALGSALRETEQRRARLVSDLAHELRTPITSLDGFVEGLEDGVFAADAETLGAMRHETRRLLRLAADLGALSRADEQAFDLHLEDADLAAIAARAAGRPGRGLCRGGSDASSRAGTGPAGPGGPRPHGAGVHQRAPQRPAAHAAGRCRDPWAGRAPCRRRSR